MKIRKLLALLTVISIIGLVPIVSNAEGETQLSGKLTIWAWGGGIEAEARTEAIELFITAHPELDVEYSVIPTADSAWDQKASAALATGTAPDVIQMSPDYYGMNTDYYMDLRPFVEADGVDLSTVLVDGMINGYYDPDGKLEGFPAAGQLLLCSIQQRYVRRGRCCLSRTRLDNGRPAGLGYRIRQWRRREPDLCHFPPLGNQQRDGVRRRQHAVLCGSVHLVFRQPRDAQELGTIPAARAGRLYAHRCRAAERGRGIPVHLRTCSHVLRRRHAQPIHC